jgi:non-heme chloroperoxidase
MKNERAIVQGKLFPATGTRKPLPRARLDSSNDVLDGVFPVVVGGKLVSERVLEDNWNVATGSSAIGTLACVDAWIEDFRQDIARNTVPTLILHGDADRILPADASSRRQAKMIKNVRFVELKGGPHGVLWTHAEQVNAELVKFLA